MRSLENCLRSCDDLDIQIIHAILAGQNDEQIEDRLYLAHSSLHYRLKRLYKLSKVKNRNELKKIFRYYLPNL